MGQIHQSIREFDDALDWVQHLMRDRSRVHFQILVLIFHIVVQFLLRNISYREELTEAVLKVDLLILHLDNLDGFLRANAT